MASKPAAPKKKYYTPAEANAALPLVRAIVTDIARLAPQLQERQERLQRVMQPDNDFPSEAHREEIEQIKDAMERDQEQMGQYMAELQKLSIELKDFFAGLIDFPCWMNNREVYLCWRLGEPEVAHWHELNAGFAGRRKLEAVVSG